MSTYQIANLGHTVQLLRTPQTSPVTIVRVHHLGILILPALRLGPLEQWPPLLSSFGSFNSTDLHVSSISISLKFLYKDYLPGLVFVQFFKVNQHTFVFLIRYTIRTKLSFFHVFRQQHKTHSMMLLFLVLTL